MHSAHGVGHAVGGRTCCHVIGMQRSACSAAGGNGEVANAVLNAPLFVGAGNGVLESGGVGGVTGDGNADLLQLHDGNAFRYVVSAVAADLCASAVRERDLADDLDRLGVGIEFGLHVGEAVDAGNDVCGVLAETVKDNAQGLYSYLVGVESDLDSALGSRK